MKIGIFTPEIRANSIPMLFKAIRAYGFTLAQFDFLSVCEEDLPQEILPEWISEIAGESEKNGVSIRAVNGNFNMAHPDVAVRRDGLKRFEKVAAVCSALSCNLITLCTGTRTRDYMWAPHPDNETAEAWRDMTDVMEQALAIAEKYNVYLGLETEASNIVNTPQKARRLLEEMQTERLKVIMDCANLFRDGMAKKERVRSVIAEAFELLGDYVVLAHGKDILEGPGIAFTSTGKGIVDFEYFLTKLEEIGYRGGMILHGIKEEKDIPFCVDFIQKKAEQFHLFE